MGTEIERKFLVSSDGWRDKAAGRRIRQGYLSLDHLWEVDEFHGADDGLVIAEVELDSETERFARPPWLGAEVSDDPRYFNINLIRHPYRDW